MYKREKMQITKFQDWVTAVKSRSEKCRVAVVAAQDDHTLDSIVQAKTDGLIHPILIGDAEEIAQILATFGQSVSDYEIIPAPELDDSLKVAVALVREGKADAIMKGKIETGPLMKALVDKERGIGKGRRISLVGFYETDKYHKLFGVTDMAVNTYPDLDGKKDILANAAELLRGMGIAKPKVAVLSAVEKVNPKMPDTVDGAALKKMGEEGLFGECFVEGPISFDLATSAESAGVKGYDSPVAGDADLLFPPDIVSANILAKCMTGLFGAKTAGLVIGAKAPVVLTSRSAEASDKYYSIALAAYVSPSYK